MQGTNDGRSIGSPAAASARAIANPLPLSDLETDGLKESASSYC